MKFCGTTVWREWHEPPKTPKAARPNPNLGPSAHETGGLSTQPWRSVKNIQTNDRQVRRRRWTFGFSRCNNFRCQLNKLRTQEYRRVANWLLNRHKKISHISVAGGCNDCAHHCLSVQDIPSSSYLWISKSNDSWQTYKSDFQTGSVSLFFY